VGVETRTTGRDSELTNLKEVLTDSKDGARVITIVADAGTGKSRLLYEFTNWLDLQPDHPRVFKARATEDMAHLPCSLIRDMFAFQFGIAEDDSAILAREKLEQGLQDLLGPCLVWLLVHQVKGNASLHIDEGNIMPQHIV
jgi:hypothetical protein